MIECELLFFVVEVVDDKKVIDIVVLNMEGILFVVDYFVICYGNLDK